MKNQLTLLVGIAVMLVLLAYMVTFQVRYDEVAVLTTFDSAEPPARGEDGQLLRTADGALVDPGSLVVEPGLKWKWPWPIQKEYTYSRKLQLLEDQLEEIQTADGYAVIMKTYLTWRIQDPHQFFRSLKNIETAEKQLQPLLRDLKSVISEYRFDELVNQDPEQLKLQEIETRSRALLQEQLGRIEPGYGIQIENVGIRRMVLPETTTEKVFERMRATRERLAQNARAEGEAQAGTIRSEAETARQRILAFAERRAQAIRAEGDREAAGYYAAFAEDEDFAIFLDKVKSLKAFLSNNATFVLDAKSLDILNLLGQGIDAATPTGPAGPAASAQPTPGETRCPPPPGPAPAEPPHQAHHETRP